LTDDLIRFLDRMGFRVEESGYDTIRVAAGDHDLAALRAQLLLYLQVWEATRPGVAAFLEPDDASDA
jgi:hypothetical protein